MPQYIIRAKNNGAQQPPAMTWGGDASISHNYAGYSSK